MKKILKITLSALFIALIATGCGSSQIKDVPAQPVAAKMSQQDVLKSIIRAGMSRGWEMKKINDGLAEATYARRNFTVTVSINYTATNYSISYKSSKGLKYNEEKKTIHKNYNSWINNLKNQINSEILLTTI